MTTQMTEAPAPTSRTVGLLTVTAGPSAGRVLHLPAAGAATLGRGEDCTCAFSHAGLSRLHARVYGIQGNYALEDAGSKNGTFVNDVRAAGIVALRHGDRVLLGAEMTLSFTLVTPEEAAALTAVYEASTKDGLTGLANRRHTDERLAAEVAFARRHGEPLAIAMADVDHFKRVNDTYGHPAGDAVLRSVARVLASAVREEDLVGRYGGEEFLVVFRATDLTCAMAASGRLRAAIEGAPVAVAGGPAIRVTASFGLASLACCESPDVQTLLRLADRRLYAAKSAGRNRVHGTG
jgi:two-component system, cell cycle response regulator